MSCYVIAEAGVNHNGCIARAKQLIDVAVDAGADAVKFQTYHTEEMVTSNAQKAAYQQASTGTVESQQAMLKQWELDAASHRVLQEYAQQRDIDFLSTPFDFTAIDLLVNQLGLTRLKVSSGDLTNGPLLLAMAQTGLPLIVSTGMATLDDIAQALKVIAFGYLSAEGAPSYVAFDAAYHSEEGRAQLREKLVLLHCTSEYPTPLNRANLRAMVTLKETFGLRVGYSDHTIGIHAALAASALGAEVIEKHFTLDKTLPGPDHAASLEPGELKSMIQGIRDVSIALGSGAKVPTPIELKNSDVARKKIVATKDIAIGEIFSSENIGVKRANGGTSAMAFWQLLGQSASQRYQLDEVIES